MHMKAASQAHVCAEVDALTFAHLIQSKIECHPRNVRLISMSLNGNYRFLPPENAPPIIYQALFG